MDRNLLTHKRDFSCSALTSNVNWWYSHQISITGTSGVGTSTMLTGLQNNRVFADVTRVMSWASGGDFMRALAKEHQRTIEEFVFLCQSEPTKGYDKLCDQRAADLALRNFVVNEGRLAHIAMPRAYHVLLTCDIDVAARRRALQIGKTEAVAKDRLESRDKTDDERYERLWPRCLWSPENYDLVIDTSGNEAPEANQEKVIRNWKTWVRAKTTAGKLITDLYKWD